jgi:hypothetical protein
MTVKTYGYDLVANVRTLVVPPSTGVQHVCIHNHEHSQNREIFIGGPDVTLANGMHAVATQTSVIQLLPMDELYAISNVDCNLRILVVK